jgi:hypothetical protein
MQMVKQIVRALSVPFTNNNASYAQYQAAHSQNLENRVLGKPTEDSALNQKVLLVQGRQKLLARL